MVQSAAGAVDPETVIFALSSPNTEKNLLIWQQKLTIGLDLGDRNGWYCVLDEAGQIQLDEGVRTTPEALRAVFGAMPCSRMALETGTHSAWISRLLSELGHEVIAARRFSACRVASCRSYTELERDEDIFVPTGPSAGTIKIVGEMRNLSPIDKGSLASGYSETSYMSGLALVSIAL